VHTNIEIFYIIDYFTIIVMPTEFGIVETHNASDDKRPRINGEQLNILLDNDAFDDSHDFIMEKRDITELLIQLQNVGISNSLNYEIYGCIDFGSIPPPFSLKQWELVPNSSGTLADTMTKIFQINPAYIWILLRLRRMTTALSTTADITTTGMK